MDNENGRFHGGREDVTQAWLRLSVRLAKGGGVRRGVVWMTRDKSTRPLWQNERRKKQVIIDLLDSCLGEGELSHHVCDTRQKQR